METTARIKEALQRHRDVIAKRPSIAKDTQTVKVSVRDGLTCDVETTSGPLVTDVPRDQGGNGEGHTPGDYFLTGLGGCLAIGYMMHAARLEVPISSLSVEINADYDLHGEYGLSDVPAGYLSIQYIVDVESPAQEADVLRVLDVTDQLDSMLDSVQRAIPTHRELRFTQVATN